MVQDLEASAEEAPHLPQQRFMSRMVHWWEKGYAMVLVTLTKVFEANDEFMPNSSDGSTLANLDKFGELVRRLQPDISEKAVEELFREAIHASLKEERLVTGPCFAQVGLTVRVYGSNRTGMQV